MNQLGLNKLHNVGFYEEMIEVTVEGSLGTSAMHNVCAGIKREKESRHRIFDLDGTVHIQERGVA